MWRRDFLKVLGLAPLSLSLPPRTGADSWQHYEGPNFTGWEVVVGDGVYAAPGEPPVGPSDIETVHYTTYSELRANIRRRRIMAHNITFKRIVDENAFEYIHTCGFAFRLPYLPTTDNFDLNAQTLEGGLFVWDGSTTRLDYGVGFQWVLNPWMDIFGEIRTWKADGNEGQWEGVGYLTPDTRWHEIKIVVDFKRGTTSVEIDGTPYPACLSRTPRAETWGPETAARLQAEIISLYPEPSGIRAMHRAEFKDWFWVWEPQPACRIFLPFVRAGA